MTPCDIFIWHNAIYSFHKVIHNCHNVKYILREKYGMVRKSLFRKDLQVKFFVKIIIMGTRTSGLTEFAKPVADELAARFGSLKRVLSAVKIEPQNFIDL